MLTRIELGPFVLRESGNLMLLKLLDEMMIMRIILLELLQIIKIYDYAILL